MDNEAAFEKFKACAVDVLQVPAEKVTPDARFGDDLDADSLDLVELVMALEESFDITVDESELEGIETVDQAFHLVTSKLGCSAQSADGPSPSPASACWPVAASASR